jgi:hypothetical protein
MNTTQLGKRATHPRALMESKGRREREREREREGRSTWSKVN